VLSRDRGMLHSYDTGDPYLEFARSVGAIPAWGTKATHGAIRDLYKVCVLGTLYGQGATSLARQVGKPRHIGHQLLTQHQRTYRTFWSWADRVVRIARHEKRLSTVFGWQLHWDPEHADADCPGITVRTMRNFPAQAHGSEMLRLALSFAVEDGVEVCAPLHDAFLIQAPLADLEDAVYTMMRAMDDASEVILEGFRLRTEVHTFAHPAHYQDPRGQPMWQIVKPLLPREVAANLDV
jgi:DNA polymerase I